MTDQFALRDSLAAERRAYYARTRGGAALIAAQALYWAAMGAVGWAFPAMHIPVWNLIAFGSALLIFPAALALQPLTGGRLLAPSAAASLIPAALAVMALSGAVTAALFVSQPEMVPLALAIGLSMHWPVTGWMFGRSPLFIPVSVAHATLCVVLWFIYPASVVVAIPAASAAAGAALLVMVLVDAERMRRRHGMML